jgi:uncharacterized membrane protein
VPLLRETGDKFVTGKELIGFFWRRKQFWIIPLVLLLLTFGILIMVGSTTGLGPFVYTLF